MSSFLALQNPSSEEYEGVMYRPMSFDIALCNELPENALLVAVFGSTESDQVGYIINDSLHLEEITRLMAPEREFRMFLRFPQKLLKLFKVVDL
jgi:hypothetical protein